MLTIICPFCGKEVSKEDFLGRKCIDCVKHENFLYFDIGYINQCSCGIYFLSDAEKSFKDNLDKLLFKKLKAKNMDNFYVFDKYIEDKGDFIFVKLKYYYRIDKRKILSSFEYKIKKKERYCKECARIKGNYYEAKVQLRGFYKEHLKDIYDKIKELEQKNYGALVKENKLKEGIDLYISTKRMAKILASSFKADKKISHSLVGLDKKGKKLYRSTLLLRFIQ